MTSFQEAVLKVVRHIPQGNVVSYGQVAVYIGAPTAARQVGWAMSSMEQESDFPWWRVVNNLGKITIRGNQFTHAHMQRDLLRSEGIIVTDDLRLNIESYRFRPNVAQYKSIGINTALISALNNK